MIHKTLAFRFIALTILSLLFTFNSSAQEANLDNGKAIFKLNCASCHNKNMEDDMTGPALGGIRERWEGKEAELESWIRNPQAIIASGDAYAVSLYKKWNNIPMTAFPNLTDQEMADLLGYIYGVVDGIYPPKKTGGPVPEVVETPKGSNTLLYVTLFLILGVLALVLARIISNLNHMAEAKAGGTPGPRKTLMQILTSKSMVGVLIFGLVVLGGYFTINNAINLGRQQGYAPTQPIKFSHATHAGLQKIDCQYCHDGARRSKHSVIPAANTCMNCHKAIKKGSKYGTAEITKIYASIGFDPNSDKYIPAYDELEEEDLAKVYKQWISSNYADDNEDAAKYEGKRKRLLDDANREANKQWDEIVASLTNETKPQVQGAIEWVRIHNLPDHVYFNHAQHVTIGKVECQTCHGPVEKMEVLQQDSPLSMGWCVSCHRQTEVQFAGNEYYNSYEKYHQELKAGTRESVTVEDIGGLECQKCHY